MTMKIILFFFFQNPFMVRCSVCTRSLFLDGYSLKCELLAKVKHVQVPWQSGREVFKSPPLGCIPDDLSLGVKGLFHTEFSSS